MRKHRHNLSEAVISRYEDNVKKLEDVFKANDSFVNGKNETDQYYEGLLSLLDSKHLI